MYTLVDGGGAAWEVGTSSLTESGGTYTLTRSGAQDVISSSNSGSAISATANTHLLTLQPHSRYFDLHYALLTTPNNASLTDATNETITWSTESDDTLGFVDLVSDDDRITIPSGYGISFVEITVSLRFPRMGAYDYGNIIVHQYNSSDSEITSSRRIIAGGNGVYNGVFLDTEVFSVSEGDYFTVTVYSEDWEAGAMSVGWFQLKVLG